MTRTTTIPVERSLGVLLATLILAGCSAAASSAPSADLPAPAATTAASPTARPPSPTAPPPSAATATFEWQRIGSIDELRLRAGGMAASPAGYAVLQDTTVWFSVDGRTWTKSTLPFESGTSSGVHLDAHANAIAGGPDGFVVVGGYDVPKCSSGPFAPGSAPDCHVAPISWSSTDGHTWRSSVDLGVPADGSELPPYSEMVLIWPAADGWDAAVEARDSVLYSGNTLLHSSDGLTWSRLKSPPLPEGATSGEQIFAHGGVASEAGRRVVWQVRDKNVETQSTLWTSADGSTWTSIPGFDGTDAFVRLAVAPRGIETGPWLLVGDTFSQQGQREAWWRSEDLVTWRRGEMAVNGEPMRAVWALGYWGSDYIALGTQSGYSFGGPSGTWLSADGETWSRAGGPAEERGDGPAVMAEGPAGLIGVGTGDEGTTETGAVIWLGVDVAH